jgi:protein tyrosine phosphatase
MKKKILYAGIKAARFTLNRQPKFKRRVKRFLLATVGAQQWARFKYGRWIDNNFPDFIEIAKLTKLEQAFKYRPLISIVVPTYSPRIFTGLYRVGAGANLQKLGALYS